MAGPDDAAGCDYCRDPANPLTDGLAAGPVMTYLLRCPACGQYYGGCGTEPHYRPPLTPAEAAEWFPGAGVIPAKEGGRIGRVDMSAPTGSGEPVLVPVMPSALRRWQRLAAWGCLGLSAVPAAWAVTRSGTAEVGPAVVVAALLLLAAGIAAAAHSYQVTWVIDPTAGTATRRRSFLGHRREKTFAATDLREIRVWFRGSGRDSPGMYLAEFAGGGLLTSGYAAEEVRRTAALVGERLGLPVADET